MTARTSHILLVFSAFLAGLVIFLGVILFATQYQGTALGPSAIGGPFKLIDQSGKPITDQDMKGRPFLVFFGYTHCPDICPTTLFEISEVLRVLGKDADRVNALFITVDPERDTPAVMKDYLSSFDPHLRGATGDQQSDRRGGEGLPGLRQESPHRQRRLQRGSHRAGLSDGQAGPFRCAVQASSGKPEEAAADLRQYL